MRKYLGLVLVGAMVAFGAGCSSSSGGAGGTGNTGGGGSSDLCANNGGAGEVTMPATITEDTFMDSDCTYLLTQAVGQHFVESGVLTIEAGTEIFGEPEAALVITTGARIEAVGTVDDPIVFTSSAPVGSRAPADWAGLVLLGEARINRLNPDGCDGTMGECTDTIEGIDSSETRGTFGGNDDTHNCGTLRYVRIEFAGFTVGTNNELNALTLGGCGSQTTLEYIQAHRGEDDGLEFFGGTANAQYVIVSGTGDDGLDTDQGYSGTIMNAIVHHFAPRSSDPSGIESDNWRANNNVEPRTSPTFQYITLIGDKSATAQTDVAINLRRGSFGDIDGAVVVDFAKAGADLRDEAWAQPNGWPTDLVIQNSCFNNNTPNYVSDQGSQGAAFPCPEDPEDAESDCNDPVAAQSADDAFAEDIELAVSARGNSEIDPGLGNVSGAVNGSAAPDYSVTEVTCMGAFAPDGTDWTTGWTAFPPN